MLQKSPCFPVSDSVFQWAEKNEIPAGGRYEILQNNMKSLLRIMKYFAMQNMRVL